MTVAELIEELKKMPEDLEVYGYTDHGQTPGKVSKPSVAYIDLLTDSIYDSWASYADEAEEKGFTKRVVIL